MGMFQRAQRYLLVFPIVLMVHAPQVSAAPEKIGVVGANSATLSVLGGDGSKRNLQQGDAVYLNDTLMTDATGRAQIMFADRSTIMIKEHAQLKIDTFIYDPQENTGKLSMTAAKGVLRFIGGALSKKQPVEIHTPVATIGIRGGVADTHIDGATGKTDSTFLYGKSLSVDSGDQHMTITTPSTGLVIHEEGGAIQSIPQAQVEQQLGSFNNTEGGATEGAQEVPSREQVQAKTSEISASVSTDEGTEGSDASSSSTSDNASSSDASGDTEQGSADSGSKQAGGDGAGVSADAPVVQTDAGADGIAVTVNDPSSGADGSQMLMAPAMSTGMAPIDTSLTQTAANVASEAIITQVKDETVNVVTVTGDASTSTGNVGGTTTTGGVGAISGSGSAVVGDAGSGIGGTGITTDTAITDVATGTTTTSTSTTASTNSTSTSTAPRIVAQTQKTFYGMTSSVQNVSAVVTAQNNSNSVNFDNYVDLNTSTLMYTRTNSINPAWQLADDEQSEYHLVSGTTTTSNADALETWLYNSPHGTMKYYHVIGLDTISQTNIVVGSSITQAGLGAMTSGYSIFTRLPDMEKWYTNTQMSAAFAAGMEGSGMVMDWVKDRFLFAKLPWNIDGTAVDFERSIAVGTLDSTNTTLSLQGLTVNTENGVASSEVLSSPLTQIYGDGAGGVEGLIVKVQASSVPASYSPLVKNTSATPSFLNQTSTVTATADYNNALSENDTTTTQLRGFTAGVIKQDVLGVGLQNLVVMNDTPEGVALQRNAANGTVGVSLDYKHPVNGALSTAQDTIIFGNKGANAEQSTLMTNNTYVAANASANAFAASGTLVSGAAQCSACRYTQWGVWSGDAPVGAANVGKADIVPYVVGNVTQNLASSGVTGDVIYSGVANANIAVNDVVQQHSGTMSASVSLGARTLNEMLIDFADVGGAGKHLTISLPAVVPIQATGDALFQTPMNVVYSGYTTQQSSGQTYGALFGPTATEMAGNVAFTAKEATSISPTVFTNNSIQGAGVYLGAR
jgi:hypothetical protein